MLKNEAKCNKIVTEDGKIDSVHGIYFQNERNIIVRYSHVRFGLKPVNRKMLTKRLIVPVEESRKRSRWL